MFASWKNDRNYFYIFLTFIILTLSFLLTEYVITGHQFGVPLDDTWIHFKFAENFDQGHFFEYNLGDPTPGTTSPLWVIVMSVPFLISKNLILIYSLFVGSLFFLLTCFEVYKISFKLGFSRNYSLLITMLTLLAGRIAWSSLSGMEITLFCYLTAVIVRIHLNELEQRKLSIWNGLLLGISINVRPEAYLLAGIYFISSLILLRKNLRENIGKLSLSIVLFIAAVLPYPIFCYVHTGGFLPNTFEGQSAGLRFIPDSYYASQTARFFIKDNFIIFLLWVAAFVYFIYTLSKKKPEEKYLLINLWIFLLPIVSSFVAPNFRHHERYLIPIIPFINITAIYILLKLIKFSEAKNLFDKLYYKKIVIILLLLFSSFGTVIYAHALGWNVDNINNQQVNIAHWLNRNLPSESTFGINDIGAITYITNRKIVDMEGLVTPEIFNIRKMRMEDQNTELLKLLRNKGVNYMIIYPSWYISLMDHYGGIFEKVYSARLVKNTICGDIEMFVFKIHWDKFKPTNDTGIN
jgi:hypothetical protein